MKQSAFFYSEDCFWHTTGEAALTQPVGGWVQPMAAGGHAESPESKRRMLNLMRRTGLLEALDTPSAPRASIEQLTRIHTTSYLEEFQSLSAQQGGLLGPAAPFGKGSFDIACISAGLAIEALATVLKGKHKKKELMIKRQLLLKDIKLMKNPLNLYYIIISKINTWFSSFKVLHIKYRLCV